MEVFFEELLIHFSVHKNNNTISRNSTNTNTNNKDLPISFFKQRRDMHYMTSSWISHWIIVIASLTPPMADKINKICLNKSKVVPSNRPLSKVAMASKVPPIAATMAQILNPFAILLIADKGASPVIKEPILPKMVPPKTTPKAIKKQ